MIRFDVLCSCSHAFVDAFTCRVIRSGVLCGRLHAFSDAFASLKRSSSDQFYNFKAFSCM